MKRIVLDSKDFNTIDELHNILKEQFDFPYYYGKNLDALWDCLVDAIISEPIILEWIDFNKSKLILGVYCEKVLEIFKSAEQLNYGFNLIVN